MHDRREDYKEAFEHDRGMSGAQAEAEIDRRGLVRPLPWAAVAVVAILVAGGLVAWLLA